MSPLSSASSFYLYVIFLFTVRNCSLSLFSFLHSLVTSAKLHNRDKENKSAYVTPMNSALRKIYIFQRFPHFSVFFEEIILVWLTNVSSLKMLGNAEIKRAFLYYCIVSLKILKHFDSF